jgi:hypothetical protein
MCFVVDQKELEDFFFSQLPNRIITHSFKRPMDPLTPSNAIFVTLQKCKHKIANG